MDQKSEMELQRRRLAEDVRQTVERDLKRRYSWLGLIVAVIVGSLVTLTVKELLFDARVELAVMEQTRKFEFPRRADR